MCSQQVSANAEWFWSGIEPDVTESLTDGQRDAISHAIMQRTAEYVPADVRLSFGRFYLVLMCGKEKRAHDRLKEERAVRPVFTRRNLPLIAIVWGALIYTTFSMVGLGLKLMFSLLA